jgi:hypothetical protein
MSFVARGAEPGVSRADGSTKVSEPNGRVSAMTPRRTAILGCALLAALHLALAAGMRAPIIFGDETANLGIARFLAGRPPYPLLAYPNATWTPYYRFGYPLLVAPAWKLSGDPHTVYRLALVLNALLVASLFPLLASFARRTLDLPARDAWIAAFSASLYTSFLLQTNLTWSESLLIPLVTGVVVSFQRLAARPGTGAACAFALLTVAAYAVHERTLALVPLALLALGVLWRRHGLSGRAALTAATITVAAFAAVKAVDATIFARLWGAAPHRYRMGDIAAGLLAPEGMGHALLSLTGQLWYLSVASALLFPLGLWMLARTARSGEAPERRLTALFTLAVAAALLATSSVFLSSFPRADLAIYGRYSEAFLAPFLAAGLAGFYGVARRHRLATLALALLPALLVAILLAGHGGAVFQQVYNEMNISGIMPAVLLLGGLRMLRISVLGIGAGLAVLAAGLVRPRAAAVVAGGLFLAGALLVHQRWLVPVQAIASQARSLPGAVQALGAREVAYDLEGATQDEFFSYQIALGDARFVIFDGRRARPPRELVISDKAFGGRHPEARLVFPERITPQALWVMPGALQDRLAHDGWLFPADPQAPLPPEALCSRLAWSPQRGPDPLTIRAGAVRHLHLLVTHCGKGSPWLAFESVEKAQGTVRLGIRWFRDGAVFAEHRAELPHALAPGATVEADVDITARTLDRNPLPRGLYEVRIGPVQELVQWFDAAGDPGIRLAVEVE